jgi:hypothetical protein
VTRRLLIGASLLFLPTIVSAQRGGTRTQADRHTDMFDKDKAPAKAPLFRTRDIEEQSPIKLLIDKRKDLKLTDSQLSQLKDAEGKLNDKNAPLLKTIDSLVRDLRSVEAAPSEGDQSHIRLTRMNLTSVLGDIRSNYDAAAKDAIGTLDAEQQTKATEMVDKQKQDADKFVQEKLGGGGRRGGGQR